MTVQYRDYINILTWVVFTTDVHGLTFASVDVFLLVDTIRHLWQKWDSTGQSRKRLVAVFGMKNNRGSLFCREREREKPQDPQKGLEKSHFGSVRCTNSEAELSSIVYTQVVKLSRLFWTRLTCIGEKKFHLANKSYQICSYTPENYHFEPKNQPWGKRKIIKKNKPPWLFWFKMFIFQGV